MEWILTWLWQGIVVAIITLAGLRLATWLNAASRYMVLWAAVLAILLIPAITRLPDPQPAISGMVRAIPVPSPSVPVPLELPPVPTWLGTLLGGLWLVQTAVRGNSIRRSLVHVRRIKQRCIPLDPEVERQLALWQSLHLEGRQVSIGVSDEVGVACMAGLGRPMILIPRAVVTALATDELDRIVVHEYGHVQRWDDWASLGQSVIETLCGWHPAIWYLGRALRLEREVACDDWVLSRRSSARAYASCLTKVADLVSTPLSPPMTLGATRGKGELTTRVIRLLDGGRNAAIHPSRMVCTTATILLLVSVVALGYLGPVVTFTNAPTTMPTPRPAPAIPQTEVTLTVPRPPEHIGISPATERSVVAKAAEPEPLAMDSRELEGIGPLMSGSQGRGGLRSVVPSSPPLDANVVAPNAATLPQALPRSQNVRSHVPDPPPPEDKGWGGFADTGRVVGTKAAEVGMATGGAFFSMATGLARVFGGNR